MMLLMRLASRADVFAANEVPRPVKLEHSKCALRCLYIKSQGLHLHLHLQHMQSHVLVLSYGLYVVIWSAFRAQQQPGDSCQRHFA